MQMDKQEICGFHLETSIYTMVINLTTLESQLLCYDRLVSMVNNFQPQGDFLTSYEIGSLSIGRWRCSWPYIKRKLGQSIFIFTFSRRKII